MDKCDSQTNEENYCDKRHHFGLTVLVHICDTLWQNRPMLADINIEIIILLER